MTIPELACHRDNVTIAIKKYGLTKNVREPFALCEGVILSLEEAMLINPMEHPIWLEVPVQNAIDYDEQEHPVSVFIVPAFKDQRANLSACVRLYKSVQVPTEPFAVRDGVFISLEEAALTNPAETPIRLEVPEASQLAQFTYPPYPRSLSKCAFLDSGARASAAFETRPVDDKNTPLSDWVPEVAVKRHTPGRFRLSGMAVKAALPKSLVPGHGALGKSQPAVVRAQISDVRFSEMAVKRVLFKGITPGNGTPQCPLAPLYDTGSDLTEVMVTELAILGIPPNAELPPVWVELVGGYVEYSFGYEPVTEWILESAIMRKQPVECRPSGTAIKDVLFKGMVPESGSLYAGTFKTNVVRALPSSR
ncbi:hypothetical protein EJ06DRAFT_523058 [Trichodelitschia bisporula]|uniref:Uncharacterized protein n=1 Tax=Trichodelitschia bisporula TaxID=703511 RepID=A0A6G1HS46_9PEZI|nr:hypothetical protein EJ06DRAFT_523058 [Trichodelitschia bisporula]